MTWGERLILIAYYFISSILVKQIRILSPILAIVLPLIALIFAPVWYCLFLLAMFITVVFGYNPEVPYYFQSEFSRKYGYIPNKIAMGLFAVGIILLAYDILKFFNIL